MVLDLILLLRHLTPTELFLSDVRHLSVLGCMNKQPAGGLAQSNASCRHHNTIIECLCIISVLHHQRVEQDKAHGASHCCSSNVPIEI